MMFNLGLACYVVSLVCAVVFLFSKRRLLDRIAVGLLMVAAVVQTVYIGMRWVEAGRAPFSNMFESLVVFAWSVAVLYLAMRLWRRIPWMGAAVAGFSAVILAYASSFEMAIKPLVPVLRSNWLTFHVLACFLGYAGFAVAFLAAAGYLVRDIRGNAGNPGADDVLEDVMTRAVSFGFLFLTLGILMGAVWANSTWGSYWSWDPKETWSLITWLIYAIYLHGRFTMGWGGRRAAWISVVGFLAVLFTYYGVNKFLPGLHSYAS